MIFLKKSHFNFQAWDHFTRDQKVSMVLIKLYCNDERQCLKNFLREKNYFLNSWNKDQCNRLLKLWWKFPILFHRDRIKKGLIYLAINIFLDKNKDSSYQTVLNYGLSLIQVENPADFTPDFLEELRMYKLKENLSWIDLRRIEHLKNQPLNILKMIILHNKHAFPDSFFLKNNELNMTKFSGESIRSFDEAAILWNLLNAGYLTNSTDLIRKNYFIPLTLAYKRQNIIDQIIESFRTFNSYDCTNIYFDRFLFRNSRGKDFNDLLGLPNIQTILFSLTQDEKVTFLKEALWQMGESNRYPIGSIWHSLDSCLTKIRIFQYQHRALFYFITKQELIEGFVSLEKEWNQYRNYPINPRLLVAMHLAKSNGVDVNRINWLEDARFLFNYFKTEFIKTLNSEELGESLFYFDRAGAAFSILKGLGLLEEEIIKKRYKERSKLDEFLRIDNINRFRAENKSIHTLGAARAIITHCKEPLLFNYKEKTVNPTTALNEAEIVFKDRLLNEPRIVTWVKENLKCRGIEHVEENIQNEVKQFVDKMQANSKFKSNLDRHYSWIDSIPSMGNINNLADCFKDKNWKEFLLGRVILSPEALGFYFLNNNEVDDFLLSNGDKIAIYSLQALQNTLNLTKLVNKNFKIKENSFFQSCPSEIFTKQVETLETPQEDEVEKKSPLIYLNDINQVVPVKVEGNYYRQLDWLGKELHTMPLIYRNGNRGNYIKDVLNEDLQVPFLVRFNAKKIDKSYTVREIINLLKDVKDFTVRYDFKKEFKKYFVIYGIEKFNIIDACQETYLKSAIFRGFFNLFIDTLEKSHSREVYQIFIEESSMGIADNLFWRDDGKTLVINCRKLSSNLNNFVGSKYLGTDYREGVNYSGFTPQIENIVIHEILRFLVKSNDLFLARMEIIIKLIREVGIDLELSNEKEDFYFSDLFKEKFYLLAKQFSEEFIKIAQRDQGGLLWLTDKIFSEASPKFLTSPSYLRYAPFNDRETIDIETLRSQLSDVTDYLDQGLIEYMKLKTATEEFIAGQPVADRELVKKIEALFKKLTMTPLTPSFSMENFNANFSKLFITDKTCRAFLKVAYERSKIFRMIFDYYIGLKSIKKDTLSLTLLKVFDPKPFLETATRNDSLIYFVDDDIHYLTKQGPVRLEKERWLLHVVLEKCLNLSVYKITEEAYQLISQQNFEELKKLMSQRGEINFLTDQILQEIGIAYPKCLSGVFVIANDNDEVLIQEWICRKIQINRIVTIEDQYIHQNIISQIKSLPVTNKTTLNVIQQLMEAEDISLFSQKQLERRRRKLDLDISTMSLMQRREQSYPEIEGQSGYLFNGWQNISSASNTSCTSCIMGGINYWLLFLNFFIRKCTGRTYQEYIGNFSLERKHCEKLDDIEKSFVKAIQVGNITYEGLETNLRF